VTGRVHVVGAGLSGLSAAVSLVRAGRRVQVFEAAGQAGGRCRSFDDDKLGCRIDNGNHLLLSGNRAVFDYLQSIGAADRLTGPARAEFPFLDLETGNRWTIRPTGGRVPWWILMPSRRVPGTAWYDYVRGLRLARCGPAATVKACLDDGGALYRRFWEPLAVAALNTDAASASAALLWPVVKETFGRGEAACRPRIAALGLGDCFVDPAIAFLRQQGAEMLFHRRLRRIDTSDGRVSRLVFTGGDEALDIAADDQVILAVPPAPALALIPDLLTPRSSRAIVNAHFRLTERHENVQILGLIGGMSQWLFVRDDVASVTISAADALGEGASEVLAGRLWAEVALALGIAAEPMPPWRLVREKRATFAQTPEEVPRRPPARTRWRNLFLAGDWTDTGLPATIEGSVRSGHTAAGIALRS
jgi:squalene-associated FAD-dependent desaturase